MSESTHGTGDEVKPAGMMERARRFVAEVQAAYDDGGYAAGDGPSPPLDELVFLLDLVEELALEVAVCQLLHGSGSS